jgi:hypothetical protein
MAVYAGAISDPITTSLELVVSLGEALSEEAIIVWRKIGLTAITLAVQ